MPCCCIVETELLSEEAVPIEEWEEKKWEEKKKDKDEEEPAVADAAPQPGDEYNITIDRTDEMKPLGLGLYSSPAPLAGLIPKIRSGTLLAKSIVRPGDRILSCNGSRDVQEMLDKIEYEQVLELRLKRPKFYTLNVNKGEGLGLSLKYGNNEDCLFIDEMFEGAVAALNRKYEDRAVRVLDCITSVNGVKDSASEMLQEIANSSFLSLTLCRWHTKAQLLRHLSDAQKEGHSPLAGKWMIMGKVGPGVGASPRFDNGHAI